MKRLTILGIIACVGLLFAPAAVAGDPQGPPGGLGVEIVNPLPVPVTGDVNATVSGDVNVVKERGRINFPNYAPQLQATFAKSQIQSQITKISK